MLQTVVLKQKSARNSSADIISFLQKRVVRSRACGHSPLHLCHFGGGWQRRDVTAFTEPLSVLWNSQRDSGREPKFWLLVASL